MEIRVNDYVRTKGGYIVKIESFISSLENDFIESEFKELVNKKDIIKSSSNIIDLIEVGDYVNGLPVIHKENDELVCGLLSRYKKQDIKSIITKEQFESIEYKVGDKENETSIYSRHTFWT